MRSHLSRSYGTLEVAGLKENDGNAQFSLCYRLNAGPETLRDRHFFYQNRG
jgi:hypothetical protein